MEPLQPFLAVGVAISFAILAAWNVLERRRYAPKALEKSVRQRCDKLAGMVIEFEATLGNVVAAEEGRRLENVKLRREFLDLIDQEEDVLGRIDTKNRRIQSAEARARQREGGGNGAEIVELDGAGLLEQIRASMRAGIR